MLLALLIVGWAAGCPLSAQTVVELEPDQTLGNGTDVASLDDEATGISFVFDKNTNSIPPRYYNGAIRVYTGNTVTMYAPEECNVSKVEFLTETYKNDATTLSANVGSVSYDATAKLYTWESSTAATEVLFNINKGQFRVKNIKVYLNSTGEVKPKPKAPVISHESGEFYRTFQAVITDLNEPATTIRYTLDGTNPTADNGMVYTAPVEIQAGADATLKAVCVNANGVSLVASATYTYKAKSKLSFRTNNKSGLSALDYNTYSAEYGSFRGDGDAYITDGSSVYLTVHLNSGYRLRSFTLDGKQIEQQYGEYHFTMPSATDVTIMADIVYDPESPSDPQPSTPAEKMYKLTVVCNPIGAASLSGAGSYKEGDWVNLSANSYSGYVFRSWTRDGETVSTNRNYNFEMPASDMVLTANYVYNPTNPKDPEQPKLKRPLTAIASPAGAATFSLSASEVVSGETYTVRANPATGYRFKGWMLNGVTQEEKSTYFSATMTDAGAQVVAILVYDPESPGNPGANYYNAATGLAIIDDFIPGDLYSALDATVGSDNYQNVNRLIVKGRMTDDDYYCMSYFKNASAIDLSRTGGATVVPSRVFQDLAVASVALPATISQLDYEVFGNCQNLIALTVYAMEPPSCYNEPFANFTNKANCIVYVPEEAVELYAAAEGWKDFTIQPITNDAHMLQVNLPAEGKDGRYKNNTIELVNINSGVRQKYVITDRQIYTFSGLRKDEQYNVYMYSRAGLEIGRIENVTIPDDDMEVAFGTLKPLHTVAAKVVLPEGENLTSMATVEWLKPLEDGTTVYLRKAVSLGEIPEGQQLVCRVTLSDKLGTAYKAPADTAISVSGANNICVVKLQPLRTITLTGTVVGDDDIYIADASVSATQTLNGKFQKTFNTKTDRRGQWTLSVLAAPETHLVIAATECVNKLDTLGAFADDETQRDMGKAVMKSMVGARIAYGFTYKAAGSEETQNFYADHRNVTVSVFNVTQNREQKDLSVQYPTLTVLDETMNIGDQLRLTAVSKTGAISPIERMVTVDDNRRAQATFDIVGKGCIEASFEMTDNRAVTAMLYTDNGELLKKTAYAEAKVSFADVDDGEYTLVTMGQSELMNSILRLSAFDEIGLSEGKDYVKNVVKVETGKIATVHNATVPAFDESLFSYTTASTSFSSNKSSIINGKYLTLSSVVDFKGVYKSDISNVKLVVDLPDACDFVEKSVIQGPKLMPYTLSGKRLTVQLGDNYQAQTRFCVIPTASSTFNATASVVFDYKGATLTQPIGSATVEVKTLDIIVPEIITSATINVAGSAPARSKVDVYSDNELVGHTTAKANGSWNAECTLLNVFNLNEYPISAKITTESGSMLLTETKNVTYITNYPKIKTVTMNTNPTIVFDFEKGTTSHSWYYTPDNVLFTLDFTDNSADVLQEVYLNIFGEDGSVRTIDCSYDTRKSIWFANVKFDTYNGIVNLSVNYIAKGDYSYDSAQAKLIAKKFEDQMANEKDKADEFKQLVDDAFVYIKRDDVTREEKIAYVNRIKKRVYKYYTGNDDVPAYGSSGNVNLGILEDADYNGGSAILFGEREEDKNPDADRYMQDAPNPYDTNVSLPGTDISASVSSDKGSAEYVSPGDYNFESIAEGFNGNTDFTVRNSNGDVWSSRNNDIPASFDADSDEAVAAFYNAVAKEQRELYAEWAGEVGDILSAADLSIALGESMQTRYFSDNFDQLVALAGNKNPNVKAEIESLEASVGKNLKNLKNLKIAGKALGGVGAFVGGWTVGTDILVGYDRMKEWTRIIESVKESCAGNDVESIIALAKKYRTWIVVRDASKGVGDLGNTALGIAGVASAPETLGASLVLNLVSYGIDKGLSHWESCYARTNIEHLTEVKSLIRRTSDCPDDMFNDEYTPNRPPFDPLTINHDPAGYVYEAVPENRVEGVQATIYYKEEVEDLWGDKHEEIVMWNAEEYAQKNPLFTDEDGMYRWDVPQGLWQVKFEKDGYLTAYSEWLPVPPPQLEVNVGITQNKQPEVVEARAYEEGVEVQFDKYMDPTTLTDANISVTAGGKKLAGEIQLVDAALADEYASPDDAEAVRYASRVRFVPEQALATTTGEIRLMVSRNVMSYAGIPMTETYSQTLDVEKEVQQITAENAKVLYGGEKELTVYALPSEAAAGRVVHIANSSDMVASLDATDLTLDAEGKAVVKIKGDLPGRTQLSFSIDDVTAKGQCTVDVMTEIVTAEAPTASRASGTAVYRGTKLELATDSKNATIYFTTDGSCPCDENGTRRKYSVPIVINGDTHIKAMTMVGSDDVSEVKEFSYTLKKSDMDIAMAEGWTWMSHSFADGLTAAQLADDAAVQRVQSQTQELVRDPQLGLIGTLSALEASESYKVETSAAVALPRISGVAWNPATPIALSDGWNWLGYPAEQTMTLDEAFATTTVEKLDAIVGQDGFAQYDGERWVGTLTTLVPGKGYMYQSQTEKQVAYNTTIVSKAHAQHTQGIADRLPLAFDKHKYPSVMAVVAAVCDDNGMAADNADYLLAAFCGSECRGVGQLAGGLLMMNVYGNVGDRITLHVTDCDGSDVLATATLDFSESLVGSIDAPYAINVGKTTTVGATAYDGNVRLSVVGKRLVISGVAADDISSVELFDINGQKVMHETHISESGIDISSLSGGVYVAVVCSDAHYTYHKIAVR